MSPVRRRSTSVPRTPARPSPPSPRRGNRSFRGGEDRDRPTHTSDCAARLTRFPLGIPLVPASPSGASLGVQVFLAFRSGRTPVRGPAHGVCDTRSLALCTEVLRVVASARPAAAPWHPEPDPRSQPALSRRAGAAPAGLRSRGFRMGGDRRCRRQRVAWIRKGNDARARCLVVVNFSPNVYYNYRVRVPFGGKWHEVLNSGSAHYGGSNVGNVGEVVAPDGAAPALDLTIPPLAAIFLVPEN